MGQVQVELMNIIYGDQFNLTQLNHPYMWLNWKKKKQLKWHPLWYLLQLVLDKNKEFGQTIQWYVTEKGK